MRTLSWMVVGLVGALVVGQVAQADEGWRIGGGVNYWESVDDVDIGHLNSDGLSYVASLQYWPGLLGIGLDAEFLPDRFGDDAFAPQLYLLVGKIIYAGAGIGYVYQNSEWADDPFYSFRAGLDLPLLDVLHLDIYGQYRFESTQQLKDNESDIDTDTVFLGAAVRFLL